MRNLRNPDAVVTGTHLSRISQLIHVIITTAVWNNPPMNIKAKQHW